VLLIRGRAGAEAARGERREKTRRPLIDRPGSSFNEESDPKERLRVSNWIVQRLNDDAVKETVEL
jgi:hypothetical protein